MGTRGLRVVRFRKRYYIFYNQFDSYPTGLGKDIAAETPADASKYQEWLADKRKTAEEWGAVYEVFISIERSSDKTTNIPEFMRQRFPSSFAPLNDTYIEWIYTVDLDREVFSVNNGAHFKLDRIPHIDWINSLAKGVLDDTISLPGTVPMDAVTNLVVEHTPQSSELSEPLGDLIASNTVAPVRQVVIPKDIKDIPSRQRHGPILNMLMFYVWSQAKEESLAASLLQLEPEDLQFRELAYAALCLAAGGKNINVVSSGQVRGCEIFGFIVEGPEYHVDSEFISGLASGAHLEGSTPGSSPETTIYWLDNVLVVLMAQLYRPGVVDEGIARIVSYCHENHSAEHIDAVLISVEHVVLVHVTPRGVVQHTAIMPLFSIENHLTMRVEDRYAESYLGKLAAKDEDFMKKEAKRRRKAYQESMRKNDGVALHYGDDDDDEGDSDEEDGPALRMTQVDGDGSTFYALVHLFEAATCKDMPLAKFTGGLLPNETYAQIIKNVTDLDTRESLMKVSRIFRRICQEHFLFGEDLSFEPSDACQECDEAGMIPKWFERYEIDTGTQSRVDWHRAGGFLDSGDPAWKVTVGRERDKRSLLAEVAFRFTGI